MLIGVVEKPEPTIILTRRPAHMKTHAGQIAFPGGKIEPSDKNAQAAALRETHEEIGVQASYIDVLGFLDIYKVGTGFNIHPIVAKINTGFTFKADPNEVAEIFEVPLSFLMDKNNFKRHYKYWQGKQHHYYVIEYKNYFIWGATADMLKNLSNRLYIN